MKELGKERQELLAALGNPEDDADRPLSDDDMRIEIRLLEMMLRNLKAGRYPPAMQGMMVEWLERMETPESEAARAPLSPGLTARAHELRDEIRTTLRGGWRA